jgi:hypothetical protein
MCTLYKRLGIDAGLTTAYHPQANGQVERKNQEVEIYLKLFTGKHQDDWADLLPTAEFVINSRLNSAMGHTLFELLYGYTPDFTIPVGRPSGIPVLDKCLQNLQVVRKDAEAALCLSKKRMQTDIEQRMKPYQFNVGDKVWLQAKQIKVHQQSAKLGPKQLGPFEVTEVRSDVDYKLAVTDLQGPPSERTPEEKLWDFKTRAQQYARDRRSCDDVRISYLEFLETEAEDDLALARMIAG